MRRAGDLEAATDKHAVTPGYVLPARELLGEMLLTLELYEEALAAFEATLGESPGRLNSLHGKARALAAMGAKDQANAVINEILAMTSNADPDARPWLDALRNPAGG